MSVKDTFKSFWETRTPNQKKTIVAASVVLAVMSIVYVAVSGKVERREAFRRAMAKQEIKDEPLLFDGDTLERDLYDRLQAELEEKSRELDEARDELGKQNLRMEKMLREMKALVKNANRNPHTGALPPQGDRIQEEEEITELLDDKAGKLKVPPPPPPPSPNVIRTATGQPGETVFATPQGKNGNVQAEVDEVVGGIGRVTPDVTIDDENDEKGAKKNTIHLAPSFMEAILLSGMDAPITGDAINNPKPTMLRIATPAVLPNRVKANLKGCFVIASGYGSLAEERINLRLVRLSCVARNGSAIIEEKVKGYIVDSDGKIGLRARVYMKADQHLVRQFVAGVAEGVANIVRQNATTYSTSPLGTTSTIDPGKVTEAGIASGVGGAMRGLADFYKKLAEQTLPTLEVGPKKRVTVVLTEGVDLNIRENCEECDDDA